MAGLEKIVNQIQEDARKEADAVLAQAKQEAEQILAGARADAEKIQAQIRQKSEKDIRNYRKRAQSAADMKKRTAVLQAKQDTISYMLNKAYEAVCAEDTETYFSRIEHMIRDYAQPGEGIIFFSEADMKRMPEGFTKKIHSAAQEAGGSLELSDKPMDIENGFVLSYGGVEENCTLKAVFETRKDELTDKVHKLLYR